MVDADSDDDDGYDDETDDVFDKKDGDGEDKNNQSKLIDMQLVKLIKFCNDIYVKHHDSVEYQEELMMRALEIGKKEKEKTLILDMDETMIGTQFEGKMTENFNADFEFDFQGTNIKVSFRPFLAETLEKLS